MEIRDPEFNRFFSEALKFLSTRRRFCGDFIFRGFLRVFLFSFLSFCFLSLSFFQTDFSFASESHSSQSLSQGDACNKVLKKVGALAAEQPSASDLADPVEYPWLGKRVRNGFWDIEANQEKYMKWLGEKLGFSTPEDWYGLTQKMIKENSGWGLLQQKFRGSPLEMVRALVEAPKGGWRPWLFTSAPNNFWDVPENQKAYMKWLFEKLEFSKPEDWYGLTQKMIKENSGWGLLQKKFRGSPAEMVMALVEAPEGGWVLWEFKGGVPDGFWDIPENQKTFMEWLGEKLEFSKPEDWYGLTQKMIEENSGGGLLDKFRASPAEMVMALVKAPEGGWVKEKFYDTSKMEGRMRDFLVRWFNGLSEPSFNDRKTHGLKFKESGNGMEADVLFEKLKFAIEYQGRQHYEASDWFGGEKGFEETQKRDREKREAFKNAGYIYIEIPYDQWAGDEVALKNLILEQLKEYKDSSDYGVKQRAFKIREALEKVGNTQNLLRFGESGSSGSESDPATSPNTASPNAASGGR